MKMASNSWVTSLAVALISLSAAILVPVSYWWTDYQAQLEEISHESRLNSQFINQFIRSNPNGWHTQSASLEEIIHQAPHPHAQPEIRIVEDLGGRTLAGGNRWLDGPLISGTESIYQGGREVGKVRISRSLEPVVQRTGLAALLGLALGLVLFLILRVLPVRALHHAHTSLHREKEQLRIVVDYALDPIVSMSREGLIESFNPAAARTFGYDAGEIIGQHIQLLLPGFEPGRTILSMEKKETGETVEGQARRKNQQLFPVEYALSSATECGKLVCIMRDITERKQAQKSLAFLANYDSLTRLPNRVLFRERLGQAMARAKRSEKLAALMFLDLDRFKIINDSLGHAIGDKLLQAVAQRLAETLRATDTVMRRMPDGTIMSDCGEATLSRLGGDEFTIILEGISHINDAATAAQKVVDAMAIPFELEGHGVYVTASIGITLFPFDDSDIDLLIKHADIAMYRSKQLGRNDYHFYSEDMNNQAHERLAMELSLRHGLANHEFSLHYQPKTLIDSGTVVGVEALLRWENERFGQVMPEKFIPILEETGLIVEIGEWVLRTACLQMQAWRQAGLDNIRLAVNLSAKQFKQPNLIDCAREVLRETGLDPRLLELEMTESLLMEHTDSSAQTLSILADMGTKISVDDFGTGYSSLAYLKRFPIHSLKIDQSFIQDINSNANDAAITQAIIALARSLQFEVVAEGVETEAQKALLQQLGCQQIQGFLLTPPLPPEELGSWLRARS